MKSRVAVEKLRFSENQLETSDRKCIGNRRRSFIGHPSATSFSRRVSVRVFQQLHDVSTAIGLLSLRHHCLYVRFNILPVHASMICGSYSPVSVDKKSVRHLFDTIVFPGLVVSKDDCIRMFAALTNGLTTFQPSLSMETPTMVSPFVEYLR